MTYTGSATVKGVDGTVSFAGVAVAAIPDSVEGEHTAELEEFKNGLNQLIGFSKSDERYSVDIVLFPKAAGTAAARGALTYPDVPSKVTLAGLPESAAPDTVLLNGDYIYTGGAARSVVRGQNALRLRCFRPLDLPAGVTITTLIAAAA